jgi:DNA ligase 1
LQLGLFSGGFGSYLLGIYDPETEQYQTVSKISTGFSEELLKELTDKLKEYVLPQKPKYYRFVLGVECKEASIE